MLYLSPGQNLPVLAFWGVGGTGKTWVSKRLREAASSRIPTARVDFDRDKGGDRMQDAAQILAAIRVQFENLACPRFDLAHAWLRRRSGGTEEPSFRGEGPLAHAWEVVAESAEALLHDVPGANFASWLIGKLSKPIRNRFRDSALFKWLSSQEGQSDWHWLHSADYDNIWDQLPHRLLEDLKESLPPRWSMACRGAVFFDTFEALRQGLQAGQQTHNRESAVRLLYEPGSPLLLVVFSRDRLQWAEADSRFEDPQHLEQHLIGGLSSHDARQFLLNCGVSDTALQDAVLRVSVDIETHQHSSDSQGEIAYHPFSLGLCATTIWEETKQGKAVDPRSFDMAPGDTQKLAQRFLRSLGTRHHEFWVKRLSWTPRFDEEAARVAYGGQRTVEQDAAWESLLDFSFVQPAGPEGWYKLHARMRAALRGIQEKQSGAAVKDHEFWGSHWAGRRRSETDDFAALEWLHGWYRDPQDALREWNALTEEARRSRRMAEHYRLLGWWSDTALLGTRPARADHSAALVHLGSELRNASLGNSAANLQQAVACYRAALEVYTREELPQDWAMTQNNLGNVLSDQGTRTAGAEGAHLLAQAVQAYRSALEVRTREDLPQDWAMTQNNLGNVLSDQGTRTAGAEGASLLAQAVQAFRGALEVQTREDLPQDWAMTQNNLGNVLSDQGTRTAGAEGARLLAQAVDAFRAALEVHTREELPQAWAVTQNNLGTALSDQGTRTAGAEGARLLAQAVDAFRAALEVRTREELPQAWATTQNNLGTALSGQGTRTAGAEGARLLAQAVDAFRAALEVRTREELPQDWATTQNNLGNALSGQGTRTAGAEGARLLAQAVDAFRAALEVRTREELPQDWATTQNNLGNALSGQGTRTAGAEGARLLAQAVDAFRAALEVHTREELPRAWATTQNNLGLALRDQGTRTAGAERASLLAQAVQAYSAALEIFSAEHFPDFHEIVQANLERALGELSD